MTLILFPLSIISTRRKQWCHIYLKLAQLRQISIINHTFLWILRTKAFQNFKKCPKPLRHLHNPQTEILFQSAYNFLKQLIGDIIYSGIVLWEMLITWPSFPFISISINLFLFLFYLSFHKFSVFTLVKLLKGNKGFILSSW